MNKLKTRLYASMSLTVVVVLVAVAFGVNAYMGSDSPKVVVEGDYIEAVVDGDRLGAGNSPWHYGDLNVSGELTARESSVNIAQTGATTDVTLVGQDSGTTYYLSATGTNIILPAVTNTGANFRFVINGASANANFIIDSAEGDNMEGTLIVAGAVVDCAAVDQINFVVDGENIGDYVEVRSDGTQWLIGDSGVLTPAKMTCTDPS